MTAEKISALALGATLFFGSTQAHAQAITPDAGTPQRSITTLMGITQKLGAWTPKDVQFKDESGKSVRFGDMFQGRAVVLLPIFYSCKTGCAIITDQLIQTLARATKEDALKPGRDFDVVMLSINPRETPELAMAKKNFIFDSLTPTRNGAVDGAWRAQAEKGWHLLTGDLASIHRVTDAVGFRYSYDPVRDLVNHPTCSIILTPKGQVSSYTIGNEFPTKVLASDVSLAAQNQIGEKADQSYMFGCLMLDPATGKVTVIVENVVRAGCVLTLIALVGGILSMSLKNKRNSLLDVSEQDNQPRKGSA